MKNGILILILCLVTCISCKKETSDKFISININDVKEHVELPLSELLESLDVIKLDNNQEAFCNVGFIYVTDNYIGIQPFDQKPYKLFDRQGKFINNIGSRGKGPGEYLALYNSQVDEKNKRVYLTTYSAKKILTYDFNGIHLTKEYIPFANQIRKAVPYVDNKNKTVTVLTLPFKGMDKYICWVQDFKGNFIKKVNAGNLALRPDFSNEVMSSNNTSNYDFSLLEFWQNKQDTLFHYDTKNNILKPVFTLDAPIKKGKVLYSYMELPNHFWAFVKTIVKNEYGSGIGESKLITVNKKTKKAQYVNIVNDFLGGWEIATSKLSFCIRNGYFTYNLEPTELKMLLEEALEKNNLKPDVRERITKLNKSLNPNDNNVLLIGKLKKS